MRLYFSDAAHLLWTLSINLSLNFPQERRPAIYKNLFLKISQYSQENSCVRVCNFIKKRLQHRCFSANIAEIFRTPILKNICERLLLFPFKCVIITRYPFSKLLSSLTLLAPISQNGQTHSNNSSAICQRIVWVSDHFVGLALNIAFTLLTHFMPLVSFYTHENIRKPEVF